MNIAVAFTASDASLIADNMNRIGDQKEHDLFLMPVKDFDGDMPDGSRFRSTTIVPDSEGIKSQWSGFNHANAAGPNSMWRQFAWYFHLGKRGPWFFWEPDAMPLVPDLFDRIASEYATCGKPFMGGRLVRRDTAIMTGVAVYPQNTPSLVQSAMIPSVRSSGEEIAFDMTGAEVFLANMHETALIFDTHSHKDAQSPAGTVILHPVKERGEKPIERSVKSLAMSAVNATGEWRRPEPKAKPIPETAIGRIRTHVVAISQWANESTNNLIRARDELRKAGLMAKAKQRKRRK